MPADEVALAFVQWAGGATGSGEGPPFSQRPWHPARRGVHPVGGAGCTPWAGRGGGCRGCVRPHDPAPARTLRHCSGGDGGVIEL
jgi:hypothetical protein